MTGISRKLPDTERSRLKSILKRIVPEDAGVIIRTAAEGASEDELTRDVERLQAQWTEIQRKAADLGAGSGPKVLSGEPDLVVKVVRDVFNEDFTRLVVSGADAWGTISSYVEGVAPDLHPRLEHWTDTEDVFSAFRVDEQLAKALDREVYLPSGGSLVIDKTEAMVVVDVNTGRFVGKGGNLEETVTRNNLEAAEEVVRQLRLRDLGGIIVVDFIDMVLESNRELVMRRLVECLGRDRTKHQVAEVTSLGLVQMTRKRVGQGLLESFSTECTHCHGRGLVLHDEPVLAADRKESSDEQGGRRGGRGGRGSSAPVAPAAKPRPFPMSAPKRDDDDEAGHLPAADADEQPTRDDLPVEAVADGAETPAPRARRRRAAGRPAGSPDGEGASPEEPAVEASATAASATEKSADAPPAVEESVDAPPARRTRGSRSPRAERPAQAPAPAEAPEALSAPVAAPAVEVAAVDGAVAPARRPRRTAGRAAGAPAAVAEAAVVAPVVAPERPVTVPVVVPVAATTTAPPRVRRRAAGRPAGPPQD